MRQYILRRLFFLIPVVVLVSIAVFWALRFMPGDVAELMLGQAATSEALQEVREELGLDKPVVRQYFDWLGQVFTGDLGDSIMMGTSVGGEIKSRLPITLELLAFTLLFTVILGVTFGVLSAVLQDSPVDYLVRVVSILGLSIPSWWFGVMVLLIPSVLWAYSPPLGYVSLQENVWDNLRQFVPPAFILGAASSAGVMRLTRSALLEVLRQDYIRTARAKGLIERRVISRHALKNAMIPVVTVLGMQLTVLLGGALIIEQVFGLEGLGRYLYQAVLQRDYPVVQAMTLYIAIVVVIVQLAVDVSYAWFDPRIRYA